MLSPRSWIAAARLRSALDLFEKDLDRELLDTPLRDLSLVVFDTETTGIEIRVKYADTAELAAILLEEGDRSPADVFFAQDPASLGLVADADLLTALPQEVLDLVPARFVDGDGRFQQ